MKNIRFKVLIKHLFYLLVFFLLPLIITLEITLNFFEQKQGHYIEEQKEALTIKLLETYVNLQPQVYLTQLSQEIFQTLDEDLSTKDIAEYCKTLQNQLPTPFDLYIFKNDRLISPNFLKLKSRFVGRRIWSILNLTGDKQIKEFDKNKNFLTNFLGKNITLSDLRNKQNILIPISTNFKDGMLYYQSNEENKNTGIMMIFWEIPSIDFIISEVTGKKYLKLPDLSITKEEETSANPTAFIKLIYQQEKNYIDENQNLWLTKKIQDYNILAAIKVSDKILKTKKVTMVILCILAVLAVILYLAYNFNLFTFISIKYKIAAIFYMSFFVSLAGFWQLANLYIYNKTEALQVKTKNQSRMHISKTDINFRFDSLYFKNRFEKIAQSMVTSEKEESQAYLNKLFETDELLISRIVNASDSAFIFDKVNNLFSKDQSKLFIVALRLALDYRYGTNLTEEDDQLLIDLLTNPEFGFLYLIKQSGIPHSIYFSNFKALAYWQPFEHLDSTRCFSIITRLETTITNGAKEFIEKAYNSNEIAPYTMAYIDQDSANIFPEKIKQDSSFALYHKIIFHTDQPLEFISNIEGKKYLVTGMKSKFVDDLCLYTLYPLSLLDTENYKVKQYFWIAFIFFVMAAFFSERLLSDFFIKPINELTKGVEELAMKNTEHRIPLFQNDELGDLAIRFNSILGGLKEMELAQSVQESLLPPNALKVEGYDIAFANRMATAVGGDYFDAFMLDENKLCAIIGDVSGHGVASGLVMAMVKATFYHGFKENSDLLKLFTDVNSALIKYFSDPETKKMITLFACIIDTNTGKGIFTNAGHNFPFITNEKGEVRELELIHLPLGTMRRVRKLKVLEFTLEPKETLLLYTDGIVEIQGNNTEQFGYDRFKENLSKMRNLSAQEIIDGKIKKYDDWLAGGEPDDDFTIAVIKRC